MRAESRRFEATIISGGLHGVGASVVNALSEHVTVEVFVNGKAYRQEFHSYEDENGKVISGAPVAPLKETGRTRLHGTRVTFLPDKRVFETLDINFDTVAKRLREIAYLNKDVLFIFEDDRESEPKKREYKYEGGICDFVKELNNDKTPLYAEPVYISGEKDGIKVELALQHNDGYTESVFSYVNNIPTTEAERTRRDSNPRLPRCMNDYCRRVGVLKDKDNRFRERTTERADGGAFSQNEDVQFEGQTKTRLGNTEARICVEAVTLIGLRTSSRI